MRLRTFRPCPTGRLERRPVCVWGHPNHWRAALGLAGYALLPALRRLLVAWKLRSPYTKTTALVIATADGKPVSERNLRRALEAAKDAACLSMTDERLSWHSLSRSFALMLATDLALPATTLARLTGHSDAGFTLRVYARDEAALVEDVLTRAAGAGVGA